VALTERRRLGLKAWLSRNYRRIAVVGTVGGIAIALWSQRDAIADFDWTLAWGAFAGSVVLFALAPLVQSVSFLVTLRLLGLTGRPDDVVAVWIRSYLLRYAPSGALALVVRVRERERLGGEREQVLAATAYEQLAALVAGALVAVAAFGIAPGATPRLALVAAAVALCIAIALRPTFLGRPIQRLLRRRGIDLPTLLRGRHLAVVVVVNAIGWLATGAGAWLLVASLSEGEEPGFFWLLGVYALSWLLGFVVPILPGGLGLRDATMVAFLSAVYPAGVATALVLAVRLASTAGELLAIGVVEAAYAVRRAAARRRPSPG
jgi:uncharacterized membrane protein YbhN (UPF0104 family)